MTVAVLRSSASSKPQWRHCGGGRRAAQISEILTANQIESKWIEDTTPVRPTRRQLLAAACRLRFIPPIIRMRPDRNLIRYLADDYLRHRWYFAHHPETRTLLIEDCIDYARIRAARDAGVAIVCLPANFEIWQRPDQRDFYSGEVMPESLHREVTFTALGDVVFCISREEQWYLANYGARADFLPYYPPAEDLANLVRIRHLRESRPPTGNEFFTVTSASNPKNREGLVALAKLMGEIPRDAGFRLHVGGHEVDSLKNLFPTDVCTFHGELTEQALEELMVRCRGSVVFQPSGVGALTRLPELLCAGIPVLANPHAARSNYRTPGIHLFHSAAELVALAGNDLPMPPLPSPDSAAETRLAGILLRFAAKPDRIA